MSEKRYPRVFTINGIQQRLSAELAQEIGLNESIVFLQLEYLVAISGHEHDGRLWTYQSVRDLERQFPYWSTATINRTLRNLVEMGLLIQGNYNTAKYDRTRWFAINWDAVRKLRSVTVGGVSSQGVDTRSNQNDTRSDQNVTRAAQNVTRADQDVTRAAQNVTTIPEITSKNTPNTTTKITDEKEEYSSAAGVEATHVKMTHGSEDDQLDVEGDLSRGEDGDDVVDDGVLREFDEVDPGEADPCGGVDAVAGSSVLPTGAASAGGAEGDEGVWGRIVALWERLFGRVTDVDREDMDERAREYGELALLQALTAAKNANVKRLSYVDAVLRGGSKRNGPIEGPKAAQNKCAERPKRYEGSRGVQMVKVNGKWVPKLPEGMAVVNGLAVWRGGGRDG